ncbi:PAS domain S-box protein [Agrobacterium tumefaciens]|nr:PAS domain S-box protein [Agrobacterium tumefaciens]NTE20894.1 PAS domain S-box protein [Agrobacterium tumefaciens]
MLGFIYLNYEKYISALTGRNQFAERTDQTDVNSSAGKDRLQKEYQRSQNRFRTIFEQSSFRNKIIDHNLQIIKVNHALLNILGYTDEEILGKKITDLPISLSNSFCASSPHRYLAPFETVFKANISSSSATFFKR